MFCRSVIFLFLFLFVSLNIAYSSQVYLWKQAYDSATKQALECSAKNFEAINFLCAKIIFKNSIPHLQECPIKSEYLRPLEVNKIASFRIATFDNSKKAYKEIAESISEKIVNYGIAISKKTGASIGADSSFLEVSGVSSAGSSSGSVLPDSDFPSTVDADCAAASGES